MLKLFNYILFIFTISSSTVYGSLINADIVFAIDISSSVSSSQFNDTRDFIINALKDYEVGYKRDIQVGIVSIYGDYEGFAMIDTFFDGIKDNTELEEALFNSYPNDATSSGSGNAALTQ